MAKTKTLDELLGNDEKDESAPVPEAPAKRGLQIANPENYMQAFFYGMYVLPHPTRDAKKVEKNFKVSIVVPRKILEHGTNLQAYFRNTQSEAFRRKNPEFVRFHKVYFDYAVDLDGKEINDPHTFSIDRLQKYCNDKGFNIDFQLYFGTKLREIVFEYFIRGDRKDEREAFYRRQDQDRKQHGVNAQLRNEMDEVPEDLRIDFGEV